MASSTETPIRPKTASTVQNQSTTPTVRTAGSTLLQSTIRDQSVSTTQSSLLAATASLEIEAMEVDFYAESAARANAREELRDSTYSATPDTPVRKKGRLTRPSKVVTASASKPGRGLSIRDKDAFQSLDKKTRDHRTALLSSIEGFWPGFDSSWQQLPRLPKDENGTSLDCRLWDSSLLRSLVGLAMSTSEDMTSASTYLSNAFNIHSGPGIELSAAIVDFARLQIESEKQLAGRPRESYHDLTRWSPVSESSRQESLVPSTEGIVIGESTPRGARTSLQTSESRLHSSDLPSLAFATTTDYNGITPRTPTSRSRPVTTGTLSDREMEELYEEPIVSPSHAITSSARKRRRDKFETVCAEWRARTATEERCWAEFRVLKARIAMENEPGEEL